MKKSILAQLRRGEKRKVCPIKANPPEDEGEVYQLPKPLYGALVLWHRYKKRAEACGKAKTNGSPSLNWYRAQSDADVILALLCQDLHCRLGTSRDKRISFYAGWKFTVHT